MADKLMHRWSRKPGNHRTQSLVTPILELAFLAYIIEPHFEVLDLSPPRFILWVVQLSLAFLAVKKDAAVPALQRLVANWDRPWPWGWSTWTDLTFGFNKASLGGLLMCRPSLRLCVTIDQRDVEFVTAPSRLNSGSPAILNPTFFYLKLHLEILTADLYIIFSLTLTP